MSLKFFNIRNKEVRVADDEMKIAALWGSSDRSPNAHTGQDFGWRLAPEVVVELKEIKNDSQRLLQIAATYGIPADDISESTILQYISSKTDEAAAPVAVDADYSDEYNNDIRKIEQYRLEKTAERLAAQAEAAIPTTTTTTTESLADMEKRAELAERIAKAEAASKPKGEPKAKS